MSKSWKYHVLAYFLGTRKWQYLGLSRDLKVSTIKFCSIILSSDTDRSQLNCWKSSWTLNSRSLLTSNEHLEKHAPLKTKIMINRPKILLFNDNIKQLKHIVALKRKPWKLTSLTAGTIITIDPHNIYVNYYSNLIDQCTGDSRKLFCRVIKFFVQGTTCHGSKSRAWWSH